MSRSIPFPVKSRLYMKSGRRCAMPNCKINLLPKITADIESNISENAHIVAFGNKGPRADAELNIFTKNAEANLILVCANCHTIIDKNPDIYPIEKLLEIKNNHEKEVLEKLNNDVQNVSFSELEDILKFLASDQNAIQEEYKILTPKEKIQKNNLSNQVAQSIMRGMIGSNQVDEYLEKHPDTQQGNRIRERFVQEYERLRDDEKLTDDDLFYSLLDFASLRSNESEKMRAGLSVLVYLFEKCEVFEK